MEIFIGVLLIIGIIIVVVGIIAEEDVGEGVIVSGGVLLILGLFGGIVTTLTSDKSIHEIETNKPIVPELRITVKDSVTIDTVYVYKIKDYKD